MMNANQMKGWLQWRKAIGLKPVDQRTLNRMMSKVEVIEDIPALPAQRIHWCELRIFWGLITIRKRKP